MHVFFQEFLFDRLQQSLTHHSVYMGNELKNNPLVDAYIATFPAATQQQLQSIRSIIRSVIPQAEEVISYKMPAYKLNKVIVFFAGYSKHIGFYPTGTGIAHFQHEFGSYKSSKGAVQFPIDSPLPEELIKRIVAFKAQEDSLK